MKKAAFFALVLVVSSPYVHASKEPRDAYRDRTLKSEVVKWVGEVGDVREVHTTLHRHDLEFRNRETGVSYGVVGSSELVKLHHESERNYLVEVEAERVGSPFLKEDYLIVRSFKILAETSAVPHLKVSRVLVDWDLRGSHLTR